MTARQDQTAASGHSDGTKESGTRQVFRSPVAIVVWWFWVLFAVANLIDLAIQGHDHISLVAAFILILTTGLMYAGVQRPRVIVEDAALTIVNPLREHRIGWDTMASADATDLVRVRCEWPADVAADTARRGLARWGLARWGRRRKNGRKTIYAWAVYSSRRRQYSAEMRAQRMTRSRRTPATRGFGEPSKVTIEPNDSERLAAALSARAEQALASSPHDETSPRPGAEPPASTWYWPAIAAIIVPAFALVVAILV